MHDVKQYFLVTGDELQQVKETQRPFLNYPELYDKVIKSNEEENIKIPITRWKVFNWRI